MRPLSPIIPNADADETLIAKDQPEYITLPCLRNPEGAILTRWKLSDEEKAQIAEQGYVYIAILTSNQPLQPLLVTSSVPDGFETQPLEEWPEEIG